MTDEKRSSNPIPHDWCFIFASGNDHGPVFHFRGMGVPERECTRGDMTEERAARDGLRTQDPLPEEHLNECLRPLAALLRDRASNKRRDAASDELRGSAADR